MKEHDTSPYQDNLRFLEQAAVLGSHYGLQGIQNLLQELGNPQESLQFVHIAGTNGKGSVLAFLGAILEEAGYPTGYYLTPPLNNITESILIQKIPMDANSFVKHMNAVRQGVNKMLARGLSHPTRFEMETALAFLYFQENDCRPVLLETGLGGTLDATNIVTNTILSVITAIGMDHMNILGNSLAEIAAHKTGIIKKSSNTVAIKQAPSVQNIIEKACMEKNNTLTWANPDTISLIARSVWEQTFSYIDSSGFQWDNLTISMGAPYQLSNAALALESAIALQKTGYRISQENIKAGLKKASHPGRFMPILKTPLFIVDGAHNQPGAEALATAIHTLFPHKNIYLVLGIFQDKEVEKMARILVPLVKDVIVFHMPENSRLLPAEALLKVLNEFTATIHLTKTVEGAVDKVLDLADDESVIIACGSLSFLGRIINYIQPGQAIN